MSTPNLNLEELEFTDRIKTDVVRKINSNMEKLDLAYKTLKDGILEQTGKDNLSEAIEEIDNLYSKNAEFENEIIELKQVGNATNSDIKSGKNALVLGQIVEGTLMSEVTTATEEDIISGKTAYSSTGELIVGTAVRQIPVNVTLTGVSDYLKYVNDYGAGLDHNGNLVIWAMSGSTTYEHVNFVASSIGVGTAGAGFGITSFDTSDPNLVPHACIVNGVGIANAFNITLNITALNGTYDYFTLEVTVTAS